MWAEVALFSIGDAVIVTNCEGQVIFMNPVARAITGWHKEALGKPLPEVFNIVDELTRLAGENPFTKLIREGPVAGMANRSVLIRKDGTEVSIEDGGAPILSEDGIVEGVVLVFQDITERRQTEQLILDANVYAESIIGTLREPLVILDQNLRVKTASQSFYKNFKVNPKETENQLLYNLGNGQWDIPQLRMLLEEVLPQNNQFNGFEVDHTFEEIGHRTMLLNARRIHQQGKQSELILLAIEDITARKEIEAGLENNRKDLEVIKKTADEALEYAESIINTVREPLIALDQDLRVVTASRSFYEVFKVNPEETLGQLIYDLGNKQWNIPKLRELLETILPHKATFDDYEVIHDFSTIGKRTMLLNARQIQRVWGKEQIILLAIEDITARKQIENALLAANQAVEAASRAKSEFLANMSHELRTPLNSIIGFSEVLHDQTFGPLTPKQIKYTDNVLTAGKHLLSLINDILDLSKVEAGKMTVEASSFAVRTLLDNVLTLVKERAFKHGLMLNLEAPADLTVSADERMLKQILFNLLSNAVKFTESGGRIAVTAERAGDDLRVSVADTGIGIKPDDQARLFTEFEQLDSGYDRMHQGTGLGLALTRKYVELHGGHIWVESEGEGKGSTFLFTLPLIHENRKVPTDAEEKT
ncbi:MAG: PAS domain S-box protein [Syntrophaceae bacterium]|nr:PAS domain S-box protein [Syntrophaceae bacterium]